MRLIRFLSWSSDITAVCPAGQQPQIPRFTVTTTGCLPGQQVATYTAASLPALTTTSLRFSAPGPVSMVDDPAPAPGLESAQTDPVTGGALPGTTSGCRIMSTSTDPEVAAWTRPPPGPVTLIGAPVVRLTATLAGTDAELAARLWDMDPATGQQALITRAVYRLTTSAPGQRVQAAFELWPAAWALAAGHQLKLEITPDDSPTWRPDTMPSAITVSDVSLTLPARSG